LVYLQPNAVFTKCKLELASDDDAFIPVAGLDTMSLLTTSCVITEVRMYGSQRLSLL